MPAHYDGTARTDGRRSPASSKTCLSSVGEPQVSECNGKAVGGIVGTRQGLERQQCLHNALHLCFGRTPEAGEGALYLERRVLHDWDTRLRRREDEHPTRLPNRHRRRRVRPEEEALNRDDRRAMVAQERRGARINLDEARRHFGTGRRFNRAVGDGRIGTIGTGRPGDNAVARCGKAGVDAEDDER